MLLGKSVIARIVFYLLSMQQKQQPEKSTSPTLTTGPLSSRTTSRSSDNDNEAAVTNNMPSATTNLPRMLCLHGKFQSAASFGNMIGGAHRKLQRVYNLQFLDAPIELNDSPFGNSNARTWWIRNEETQQHTVVKEAVEYVQAQTTGQTYRAVIGFSQGGTLATALALSGALPGLQAVVTAGAPDVPDVFDQIDVTEAGLALPKLHLAGATDDIIAVASTQRLSDRAGNGQVVVHEKGHLFPTKAAYVNQIMDFLQQHVKCNE